MKRLSRLVLLAFVLVAASACGNKGPLVLPDKSAAQAGA